MENLLDDTITSDQFKLLDDYHRELILGMLDLIAQQTATQIVYVSHVLGEQPACINQKLLFVKSKRGGYTLSQI